MSPASIELLRLLAISVGFLTAMGLALAAMLVAAERSILNYGDCSIDINNGEKTLTVAGGNSLLASLSDHDIFIPSACGGKGSCAYCKLRVLHGGGAVGPVEEPSLSDAERGEGIRLSCQVKVRGPLRIEVPRHLFSVKRFSGLLEHKKQLTGDIVELRIRLLAPETITFTAGQYMQLESAAYQGREPVMRAYSISSLPSDNRYIELITRLVPGGICTTWIFEHLREGQRVQFSGPYGTFRLSDSQAPILFIAGGSGMAPIWSMLRHMCQNGNARQTTYFFGALTQADLFYRQELDELQRQYPWFTFIAALSKEPPESDWSGERGLITDVVARRFPDTTAHEAYLCGSPGMIDACVKVLIAGGMPGEHIFYDKFA